MTKKKLSTILKKNTLEAKETNFSKNEKCSVRFSIPHNHNKTFKDRKCPPI